MQSQWCGWRDLAIVNDIVHAPQRRKQTCSDSLNSLVLRSPKGWRACHPTLWSDGSYNSRFQRSVRFNVKTVWASRWTFRCGYLILEDVLMGRWIQIFDRPHTVPERDARSGRHFEGELFSRTTHWAIGVGNHGHALDDVIYPTI